MLGPLSSFLVKRFSPDAAALTALGYESVSHVPVLFGIDGRYEREINRYLRDCATLRWPDAADPNYRFLTGQRLNYPRVQSLEKTADSLVNFLKWLEYSKLNWREITFDPHLRTYRRQQFEGEWSRDRQALSGPTIESRLRYVVDFLSWAVAHGLRERFVVPMTVYRKEIRSGDRSVPAYRSGSRAAGAVRANPQNLRLPEPDELTKWVTDLDHHLDLEKTLVCRTILATAIRLREASLLPFDFIPMLRADWHVTNDGVQFLLTEGTKGGRSRYVTMPLAIAEELHRFRTGKRVKNLAKWIRNHPGETKPRQLFLGSFDGTPFSRATIYKSWTSARIFPGWSPHLGRHTWACYSLLDALQRENKSVERSPTSARMRWVPYAPHSMRIVKLSTHCNRIRRGRH
jgi:integrase